MTPEVPYRPLPLDQTDVRYAHGPQSTVQPDVPPGETLELRHDDSSVYPGTTRRIWIHLPAGHDPAEPASAMVFNDGWWYLDPDGEVRAGVVLDNLTHSGGLTSTVGVFVDPGLPTAVPDPAAVRQRNVEYDAFDDRYATFLLEEVLPRVGAHLCLSEDPARRGIGGGSAGGSCAFTAVWHRPDAFGKVLGFVSSFAQLPGGNPYPELLARLPRRPLRVLLQAAHRDLGWDQPERNWLAENLRVAAALAEAGYDHRLVLGDGPHSPNHAGVLLPDALRWLWRDSPTGAHP